MTIALCIVGYIVAMIVTFFLLAKYAYDDTPAYPNLYGADGPVQFGKVPIIMGSIFWWATLGTVIILGAVVCIWTVCEKLKLGTRLDNMIERIRS